MSEIKSKVIIKRPDEQYGHVTNISTTLKNLQKTVNGQVSTTKLIDGLEILHNTYGRELGEAYNCAVDGVDYYGTIVVVGKTSDGKITEAPISFSVWKHLLEYGYMS